MKAFELDQTILDNGNYRLNKAIVYHSPRYKQTITVPAGFESDGATGAMDITSRGWWIHDVLCKNGKWDNGTKLNNWQCSQVLQDVLAEEGRYWQSKRWFWATWLFGGDKARQNGLWMLAFLLASLTACTPLINVSINNGGDSSKQSIRGESDQAPTTNAAIPVSVGAQPNSTGTVGK